MNSLVKTTPRSAPASDLPGERPKSCVQDQRLPRLLSLLLLLLFVGQDLQAQAPANDNRANALELSGDTASSSANNTNATKETGDFAERTVWWRWTAPAKGRVTMDTAGSGSTYISMAVYLVEAGVSSGMADGAIGFGSTKPVCSFPVTQGSVYLIGLGVPDTSASYAGSLNLLVTLNRNDPVGSLTLPNAATMANDSFANRVSLSGNQVSAVGYNISATEQSGEPAISGTKTLWWTYTPAANGRLTITTQNSDTTNFNSANQYFKRLAVYLGTSLTQLSIVDAGSVQLVETLSFPVTAGTAYQISVGSLDTNAGSVVLSLSLDTAADVSALNLPNQATMANDSFASRISLAGASVSAIAYNNSAGTESNEPAIAGGKTFWWTYRPAANGRLTVSTQGSDTTNFNSGNFFYKNLAVYLGSSLSSLRLVDAGGGGTLETFSFPVTANTDYVISLGSGDSSSGSLVLTLTMNAAADVSSLNIPNAATMANDSFASRIPLTQDTVSAIAYPAEAGRENSEGEPAVSGSKTFWWSYTPTATGRLTISTQGSDTTNFNSGNAFSKRVVVYQGLSFSALQVLSQGTDSTTESFSMPVTANTTYQISVGSMDSSAGSLVLTFSLNKNADVSSMNIPNPATMANDAFANSILLAGDSVSAIAYNISATREEAASEPSVAGQKTLWWRYQPSAIGRLTISTQGSDTTNYSSGSTFYKRVCVYMGNSLSGLRVLDVGLDRTVETLSLPVTGGVEYVISVASADTGGSGSLVISLSLDKAADVSALNVPNNATLANDAFASRIPLTGMNVSAIGYITPAGRETDEPAVTMNHTLWWTYRAPATGRLTITTQGSDLVNYNTNSDFNKRVTVHLGTTLQNLRLVDTGLDRKLESLSIPVTAGTDYQISLGSTDSARASIVLTCSLDAAGDVAALNIPVQATMANDTFSNRITLSGNNVSAVAYNVSATREDTGGEPAISGAGSLWWGYTPAANGRLTFSTQGSDTTNYNSTSSFEKRLVIYQGDTLSNLRAVATGADGVLENFSLPVTANTPYVISLGTSGVERGSLILTLSLNPNDPVASLNLPNPATISNDAFADRVTLAGLKVSAIGYTLGATRQVLEPTATGQRTLWWSWVAPTSGNAVVDFTGTAISSFTASIWQGADIAVLTQVPLGSWTGMQNTFPVTAGQTYHLATGTASTTTAGSVMVLTLTAAPSKPVFGSPLASRWVEAGQPLEITPDVSASGTTFRWQKGGVFLTTATSRIYNVSSSALTDAGAYRVEATNNLGTTLSDIANVGVIQMAGSSLTLNEGATLKLTVSAAGPSGTLSYRWTRAGMDLADGNANGQKISGSDTATLTITGVNSGSAGEYACRVTLANAAAPSVPLSKLAGPHQVSIRLRPVVTDTPPPVAAVSQPFTWQLMAENSATSFAATGLPRGLVLNTVSGLVTGAPEVGGNARISVTARNAAGVSTARIFNLNIGPLRSGVAGTYAGLVGRQQVLNAQLGGTISITVSSTGALTGTLKMGTNSHSLKGRVVTPPSATTTASLTVLRAKLPALTVNLDLQENGGLDGHVAQGAETAPVEGWLNSWKTDNTAAAYAGAYNVLLDLPAELAGDADTPQGFGWLQIAVTAKTGVVKITGRTPDGAAITASSILWPDGSAPLHALLYSNKGSIRGLPRITLAGAAPAYADNQITGEVDWQKNGPASSNDRTYATGFGPILLSTDGSKWVRPASGTMLFNLPNQPGNLRIELAEGDIASAAQATGINQTFQMLPTGACKLASASGGNPTALSLSVTTATGLFSGSFKLTDPKPGSTGTISRSVKISGIMIPHLRRGYGQFLLPGLIAPSPVKAGSVVLREP